MKKCMVMMVVVIGLLSGQIVAAPAAVKMTDSQLAEIVKNAPKVPVKVGEGLRLKLIDFIDCTDDNDPHEFISSGPTQVVESEAGRYRITPSSRHASFSYMYKTAGKDMPVLVVIEYPDDAERKMGFLTHDSMRPRKAHISFSQEGGVYTGKPLPVTNKMQYYTNIGWMQDDWSPMIIMNYTWGRTNAAASRIWVYAIENFTKLRVTAPDRSNKRELDSFYCLGFLAKRDNFGWQSKKSIEHMVDYLNYIGVTRATMMLYANQSWGAMVTVPAWDTDDKGYLDDVLTQMDRKGGCGLLVGFVADSLTERGTKGMYGAVKSGGKIWKDMEPEEAKKVILKGFDQMIDKYGKYKSFKGFAFGSMETIGFYDTLHELGVLQEVIDHIKAKRPDLEIITYLGNVRLQTPYFSKVRSGPTVYWDGQILIDVLKKWERKGGSWSDHLGDEILSAWKELGHDPAEMKSYKGLDVYEMMHPDDHRVHGHYRTIARTAIYYDTWRSQRGSDHADSPYAAIFNSFDEGWIGLSKQVGNFWYDKDWTAPDYNAGGKYALASFAQAMAHRDRQKISAGAWTVKYLGYEQQMRRFARAFLSLPPVDMIDVKGGPDSSVVRWVTFNGKRYISAQSIIPFDSVITIDGKTIEVPAYELVAMSDDGTQAPIVAGEAPADYVAFVQGRIDDFMKTYQALREINPKAGPVIYRKTADAAQAMLDAGNAYGADIHLGFGLQRELEMRKDILDPPEKITVAKIDAAVKFRGNLDKWPSDATDLTVEGGDTLGGHTYFNNSWFGFEDLSFRMRLAHDGEKLYVGLRVYDNVLQKEENYHEGGTIALSNSNYRDYLTEDKNVGSEVNWPFNAPIDTKQYTGKGRAGFEYTCTRTKDGYLIEGSAPLNQLKVNSGDKMGIVVRLPDRDGDDNLKGHSWEQKQTLVYPYQLNFAFWGDARTGGELIFE